MLRRFGQMIGGVIEVRNGNEIGEHGLLVHPPPDLPFSIGQENPKPKRAALQGPFGLSDEPQLQQNTPNPFNSQTVIPYFLLKPGPARVEVFALTGQRVAVLNRGPHQAGRHRLHWDGRDGEGRPLASGIYLYRLVTAEDVLTRKLTLLR